MGQLSEEGIAKKIAEQISAIAFTMPHKFQMDREFAVLQKAALEAFRQQYPEREHFPDEIAADFYRTIAAKSIFAAIVEN